MAGPFIPVPKGGPICVENPDGVFHGPGNHSLYDRSIPQPTIPGNYDIEAPARAPNDAGRLHGDVC